MIAKFLLLIICIVTFGCSSIPPKVLSGAMPLEELNDEFSYNTLIKELKLATWDLGPSEDTQEYLSKYIGLINSHIYRNADSKVKPIAEISLDSAFDGLNRYVRYLKKRELDSIIYAANSDDGYAQYLLVDWLKLSRINEKDVETAIYWLNKSIKNGYSKSMTKLSYYYSVGPKPQFQKSLHFAVDALSSNVPGSYANLGKLYSSGAITNYHVADKDTAYLWYLLGAENGERESMYELGIRMLCLNCDQKNEEVGKNWIDQAAKLGFEKALFSACNDYSTNFWLKPNSNISCINKLAFEDNNYFARSAIATYFRNKNIANSYILNKSNGFNPYIGKSLSKLSKNQLSELDKIYKLWKLRFIE